jgi:hypothetical protein
VGQLDFNGAQSATDRLSDSDLLAALELACDVDDQAQPTASVIKDNDAVVFSKWTSEPYAPTGRRCDCCTPARTKHDAA